MLLRGPLHRLVSRLSTAAQRSAAAGRDLSACWSLGRLSTLAVGAGSMAAGITVVSPLMSSSAECQTIAQPKFLCLHGVNLNMFGKRDPATYGTATLSDINDELHALARELGVEIETFQTNHEGEMVEKIHKAHLDGSFSAVLINSGAWTHYSYGLRDALAILDIPVIEVHMSNIHAREDMKGSQGEQMRHHSVVSPLAKGIIAGFGVTSYLIALRAAVAIASSDRSRITPTAQSPSMMQKAVKIKSNM